MDGFPVVGIVGAGQLARMCQQPAVALSVALSVLAESASESAAQVVPDVVVGAPDDLDALRRLAERADVVTFDHEHVPQDALSALAGDGVSLHPGPAALRHAQDKAAMRQRLGELGVPCPRWALARTLDDVEAFGAEVGWPLIAKTPRGGYDGKGVRTVDAPGDVGDWRSPARSRRSSLAPPAATSRRGRWSRPSRPTGSAPRCSHRHPTSPRASHESPPTSRCEWPRSSG